MKNDTEINIDVLLRDTWLTVVELRQGTPARRGVALYHHCQQQVEWVRQTLLNAGFSQQDAEHITYAQCALLDETVLSRETPDDGQKVWLETPLQAHFFNTLQAGELLYERIRQVLHEPAPVPAVLTCFHRVLLLGFRGRYQDPVSTDREKLIAMLSERVTPFRVSPETALLNAARPTRKSRVWYSPLFWLSTAVIVLVGVWWGLDSWLDMLVDELLPPRQR